MNQTLETPWGRVSELRGRRLAPGPGSSPEQAARNQRERIFAAMFACVAEHGYESTKLAEVVALAGVSRRTFYDLFSDKETCFEALIGALTREAARRTAIADPRSAKRDLRAAERFESFARLFSEQPTATRICLLDAHAVEGAAAKVGAMVEIWEAALGRFLSGTDPGAQASPELVSILVGGIVEILRDCLQKGRSEDLGQVMVRAMELVLSYRPPPEPLRMSTRPPREETEPTEVPDHRERAVRALAEVSFEVGYRSVSVGEVIERAGMSAKTFYANFSGKEDVTVAAVESAAARALAAALPAFRRHTRWGEGVRAAIGAMLNFLAARPALARLLMVDAYVAGPRALEARDRTMRPLETVLAPGWGGSPEVSSIIPWAIAQGFYYLARKRIAEEGAETLPGLAPLLTYAMLFPFLGAEAASAAANGTAHARRDEEGPGLGLARRLAIEPAKREVANATTERPASVEEIAAEVGLAVSEVEPLIEDLLAEELVEALGGGEGPVRYTTILRRIPDEHWEALERSERERISARVGALIFGELEVALEAGTFDGRADRHLTRVEMRLDPEGWRALLDVHDKALEAAFRIKEESERRLLEEGERGISARSVQTVFEMPGLS